MLDMPLNQTKPNLIKGTLSVSTTLDQGQLVNNGAKGVFQRSSIFQNWGISSGGSLESQVDLFFKSRGLTSLQEI